MRLSDPTSGPLAAAPGKGAAGAWPGGGKIQVKCSSGQELALQRDLSTLNIQLSTSPVRYIEPHAHMVSRTTDDYVAMTLAGCAAVCEPAFWAGFDRSSAQGFYDYFSQLTDYEPKLGRRSTACRIFRGCASTPRKRRT